MPSLKLTGTAGIVKGASFTLAEGDEAAVGRSRSCGVSLYQVGTTARAKVDTPMARAFRGISRRHARIRFRKAREVEITDQSRHGTLLDGEKIETVILTDLKSQAHTLRLGKYDTFRIELVDG